MLKKSKFNRVYLNIIIALAILYCMPLVLSQGLLIDSPSMNYIKQNEYFNFNFYVFNDSDGNYITSATCFFNLYNQTGNIIYQGVDYEATNFDYSFLIDKNNFTKAGNYYYMTQCNTSSLGGYLEQSFEVNLNGYELNNGKSLILIFFMIIFLLILSSTTYVAIYSIGHLTSLDFDVVDLAYNWGLFFFIAGFYYFEMNYLNDIGINKFMDIFLYPAGLLLIVIPIIALLLSVIVGSLNKKMYRQRVPKRFLGGRHEKEI